MREVAKKTTEIEIDPNFMVRFYSLIAEPLNLLSDGQRWFREIYKHEVKDAGARTLVLGATSWLAELAMHDAQRVLVVDMSPVMLKGAQADVHRTSNGKANVEFIEANWKRMPESCGELSVVLGDNSLAFLAFPDEWSHMVNDLADRMIPGATLMFRTLSPPRWHRPLSCDEIVAKYLGGQSINYTAVRAELLFAQWDRATYTIDTERALDMYETNRTKFEVLFKRFQSPPENDLAAVEKYRGAGAVYHAPPLDELLSVMRKNFRVAQVCFGPYPISDYFPLFVAYRR
jgi:SAM-dependent methyltransferase